MTFQGVTDSSGGKKDTIDIIHGTGLETNHVR